MLQRSTWSGLLLSAAVVSTTALSVSLPAFAQETPAPAVAAPADAAAAPATTAAAPADAAPAPVGPLKSLADDFMHYSLVNNVELAKANAQAILNANPAPQDLVSAFEDAANGRDPQEIMERNEKREELRDVSAQLLDKLRDGYRTVARDPKRIRDDIDHLANGPRAYNNAKDHLTAAGQYAAPLLLEYLQNQDKKTLHPYIVRVMGEIGRPLMLPLLEALKMNDQGIRITIVKIVGQIGYPQALPILRKIQADPETNSELKATTDQAIALIDHSGSVAQIAPAALFLKAAEFYYEKRPSYQPLQADEKTNPVWVFDKGLNNVAPLNVPTPIWNDVMAMRYAETALTLDKDNSDAISVWLASNMRREINLPTGVTDPTKVEGAPEAVFFARAFGPKYVNPVLKRALEAHDEALTLKAIDALEATGGISGLVSQSDGAPLIKALTTGDRNVRLRAAFALARANPAQSFPSAFRVVPTLSEALASDQSPVVLIVSPDEDARNKMADSLRKGKMPMTVFTASTLSKALDDAGSIPAVSAVLSVPNADVATISAKSQTDPRLLSTQVVIVGTTGEGTQGYKSIAPDASADTVATALGMTAPDTTEPSKADSSTTPTMTSLSLLKMLAMDHKSIYSINDAVPALIGALKNKDGAVVKGSALVLGELNSGDAQKALANAAMGASDATAKAPLLDALAESAKHTGNTLDAETVNSLIAEVQTEKDMTVRLAAATALGALNVPSNQASSLILQQSH